MLQKSGKAFESIDGNTPLSQLLKACNYNIDLRLIEEIEDVIDHKLLFDYLNLSEIEKSHFTYAYILDNPQKFEGLYGVLVTDRPFYGLDTKLKGVITPNDFLENITD
jgi:hypothetical protein